MNELRELIQQVEDRGGPLYLMEAADDMQWVGVMGHPVAFVLSAEFDHDSLAGVLRRDLVERFYNVVHEESDSGGERHTVEADNLARTYSGAGDTILEAMLHAWIAVMDSSDEGGEGCLK